MPFPILGNEVWVRFLLELEEFSAKVFEVWGEGRVWWRAVREGGGEEVIVGLGDYGFALGLCVMICGGFRWSRCCCRQVTSSWWI